jgi:cytochrome b
VVGTRHARFVSFVKGYRGVRAYAASVIRPRPPASLGHNPLGGWMIVLLLLFLSITVGAGLFAGGPAEAGGKGASGPFAALVSRGLAETLSGVHAVFANLMIALIVLHVLGVLIDWLLTGDNIVRAMITGRKHLAGAETSAGIGGSRVALAIPLLAAAIALVVYVLSLA